MNGALFYLVGWPASGKRTVGQALAELTGARLIDNHLIHAPIFRAVGADGSGPLPEGVWPPVGRARDAVLEAIADVAPSRVERLAARCGARIIPVWLRRDAAELRRRVTLPEPAARLKLQSAEALDELLGHHALLPPPGR